MVYAPPPATSEARQSVRTATGPKSTRCVALTESLLTLEPREGGGLCFKAGWLPRRTTTVQTGAGGRVRGVPHQGCGPGGVWHMPCNGFCVTSLLVL